MIRIGEKSLYYHHFTGDQKPRFVEEDELLEFLSDEVRLDKTVTFERLFKLMLAHHVVIDTIFNVGCLYGHSIEQYVDEFMKFDDDEDPDSVDYLEAYWHSEYWNFDGEKELSCYPAFHGIKENFTDKYIKEPCRMNMGLDFTPVNQLRKYKVKINPHIQYNEWNKKGKTIEERYPLLVEGDRQFTLFDLFRAILHDISFYGTPENRNSKRDELDETVKRIDSGEEKLYQLLTDDEGEFIEDDDGNLKFKEVKKDDLDDCGCGGNCDCNE